MRKNQEDGPSWLRVSFASRIRSWPTSIIQRLTRKLLDSMSGTARCSLAKALACFRVEQRGDVVRDSVASVNATPVRS